MNIMRITLVAALAAVLVGCESAPVQGIKGMFQSSPGQQDLANGVKEYEDGNYAEASRLLQSSLDQGLSGKSDQVRAHKYLAFIHCVSGRDARCRNEFRAALKIDPAFELAASEIGHPVWGPVFKSVKAKK